ncbi:unnamed protein product [Brassica oleracea]|uniref:(rape) hypothetical protein n=1 Tax=Brassica napus TaxID=3708 RepID=A0A816J2Y4_BRANA|nr:unnamed protein product [Brassica napus]
MRPAYRSSKKDDKLEGDAALNKFFRKIYLNSDEDMRILHNQQVESNGTVLSIDWKDVGAQKIEYTLHDDLALKTWEI